MTQSALLEVKNLNTGFETPEGIVRAANDLNFTIEAGEAIGVVGESGSGKTQAFLAIMGLLASNGKATGSVRFQNNEILGLNKADLNKIRGDRISMIFQDPMTSLNPYLKISRQMTEVLIQHEGLSEREARKRSIEALEHVRIPEAAKRFDMYPHEFSGGMRQRVMIAMALLCKPDLLIADEPTTALDVTVQAQILDLMQDLRKELNMAIAFITHDLGVVAGLCDRVFVMYAGRIIEEAPVKDLFYNPQHPYTEGLLKSSIRLDEKVHDLLSSIPGHPPNLQCLPKGCPFRPRCAYAEDICKQDNPEFKHTNSTRGKACHLKQLPN